MHSNHIKLNELILDIVSEVKDSPILHMLSPTIIKLDFTIPDSILDIYTKQDNQ